MTIPHPIAADGDPTEDPTQAERTFTRSPALADFDGAGGEDRVPESLPSAAPDDNSQRPN
ncbi:hypothetical protein [Nocardia bovistercoris]|uniref:Uncharacterized protein n=1 Tax=Nocardia bovistercoris TaxID=2785916 RepID=A0A931IFP9_9NOCA|nr:hypothetical protein [Nocardia bovistercoris]MBH0780684.1 hypothetical protein [Nocardia bovistercoris]